MGGRVHQNGSFSVGKPESPWLLGKPTILGTPQIDVKASFFDPQKLTVRGVSKNRGGPPKWMLYYKKSYFCFPPQKEVGKVVSLSPLDFSHRVLALRRFLEPIGRDQVGGLDARRPPRWAPTKH